MTTSTGTETTAVLQYLLDALASRCLSHPVRERQELWNAGLASITRLPVADADPIAFQDAVQDAGYRLGLFYLDAKTLRFYRPAPVSTGPAASAL